MFFSFKKSHALISQPFYGILRETLTKVLHHLPYEKGLERLGLTDLKTRRERGDFIQIYKIVHDLVKVN